MIVDSRGFWETTTDYLLITILLGGGLTLLGIVVYVAGATLPYQLSY